MGNPHSTHSFLNKRKVFFRVLQVCFDVHLLQYESTATSYSARILKPTMFQFFFSIVFCGWIFGGRKIIFFFKFHCVSALLKLKLLYAYSRSSARQTCHKISVPNLHLCFWIISMTCTKKVLKQVRRKVGDVNYLLVHGSTSVPNLKSM